MVSPVKETKTHPQANALTWAGFKVITEKSRIPCYALGGLETSDISVSQAHGGQGIAGISCFCTSVDSLAMKKNMKQNIEGNIEEYVEKSNKEKSYES